MTSKAKIYYGQAGVSGPYLETAEPQSKKDVAREIEALESLSSRPFAHLSREELEMRTKIVEWGRWTWEGMGGGEHPMYLISTSRKSSANISDDEAIETDAVVASLEVRQREVLRILYVDRKPLMLAARIMHMDRQTMRNIRQEGLERLLEGLIARSNRVAAKTA
jgi:DNA-directed RNA polymerase specialized sigma24 family protein